MKIIKNTSWIILVLASLFSCQKVEQRADGYGNFEATETTISAQSNGKLMAFKVEEGNELQKNAFVGYTDTIPLALKKEQLQIAKSTIYTKSRGVLSQINVFKAQLESARKSKKRIENLLADKIGTQKQLDDVLGKISVINQQIESVKSNNRAILSEYKNIDIQIKQINDKIEKCKIFNPVRGTVLVKYVEPNEVVGFSRPLYKIADLSTMKLRVYVSETQLSNIKLNQKVTVKVDNGKSMKSYEGVISWIASEAEFTPKIIQTKEERVALVYAVKIDVKNDGSLKIGMPAEMWIRKAKVESEK